MVHHADDVVVNAAEHIERVVQQVHLQDGLVCGHGLDGKALGADDVEIVVLHHVELCGNGGDQRVGPQVLGQPRLVLADAAVDEADSLVNGAAHVAIGILRLGAEQRAVGAADGQFYHAAVLLLHGKGHKGVCLLRKILIQLADLLFRVFLDGVVEGNLLAGECELHNTCSFRQCGKHRVGSGSRFPLSLPVL